MNFDIVSLLQTQEFQGRQNNKSILLSHVQGEKVLVMNGRKDNGLICLSSQYFSSP